MGDSVKGHKLWLKENKPTQDANIQAHERVCEMKHTCSSISRIKSIYKGFTSQKLR